MSWKSVSSSRYFDWLNPVISIRLVRSDGAESWWNGRQLSTYPKSAVTTDFEAIEVSENLVLRRQLQMPVMPASACARAVELEVRASSPFVAGDVIWGWHAGEVREKSQRVIEVVFASRKQVLEHVERLKPQLQKSSSSHEPEVWILANDGTPIVLSGWGEHRRVQAAAFHRRLAYSLLLLASLILVVTALTPSLQLRLRSLDAIAEFDTAQRDAATAIAQRDALSKFVERLEVVRNVLDQRADMLLLMTALTKALPDDTYLQSIQTQGLKVTIQGLTADAAALMQTLGAVPGFKEVKAPQAATRAPGATAENFRIELQLDPTIFSLSAGAVTDRGSQPVSDTAPSASVTAASSIIAQPASSPAAASASAPASTPARPKSRFSMGG